MLHLKAVVRDLEKTGQDAGFRGRLSCDVVRQHLAKAFGHAAEGSGFLERGVTFCSMLPMRSIPLKVICLMGMNHEAFPRRDYTSGLDLTAMDQRRGDRSRRDDDLYLFLEALLSARNVLSISYIGQGIQDNAPIPPSVVVSSLLEYLDRSFVNPGVARSHCLQAFSPKYFTAGTGLFSYSQDNALAARALRRQGQSGARSAELADPGRSSGQLTWSASWSSSGVRHVSSSATGWVQRCPGKMRPCSTGSPSSWQGWSVTACTSGSSRKGLRERAWMPTWHGSGLKGCCPTVCRVSWPLPVWPAR